MHTHQILARTAQLHRGLVALLLCALPAARAFDAATAGSALSFSGNAHVFLGNNSNLKPTGALTLELWAYSSNWTTAGRLISSRQTSGGYALSTAGTSTTKLGGEIYAHGAIQVVGVSNSTVPAGWHHFALTYDGRYLRFYLDGTHVDSKDLSATYPVAYTTGNVLLAAEPGTGTAEAPSGQYFAGKLDEIRIWNVARTQDQLRQAMLSSLAGTETGLVAYYACNEGSGTTLSKLGVTAVPVGQLRNSTTWGPSGVPRAELWVDDDYTSAGSNDGHTWGTDAFSAIGTAVNAAFPITLATTAGAPNQTIRVKAGTYSGASNRDMDFAGKLLAVRAEAGAAQTIIDCGSAGRAFYFHTGETAAASVQGFSITRGSGSPGGAIFCEGSAAPTLADCIFTANRAPRGGAIGVGATASPTLRNCTFARNSADGQGGALYIWDGGPVAVAGCVFTENTTRWYGGAVVCVNSSSTFTDCLFAANRTSDAADQGGAIFFWTGSPSVRNCRFVGNQAVASGGAVYCQQMTPVFTDCLFLANQVSGSGGAFSLSASPAQLTNCTLAQNWANQGGGIHCVTSSPVLKNTLLAGNTGIALVEADASSDPVLTNCLFNGSTGGDYRDENATTLTGAAALNGLAGNSANLDGDPRLAPGLTGTWTAAPAYSATTSRTTLTHAAATFTAGALVGRVLKADTSQSTMSVVLANTATAVEVSGDVTGFVAAGETYRFLDYHITLGSAAIDTATSTGAPATDLDGEARPWPVGGTVDIGADEFLDTDGDQLADTREADLGTDPHDPDSDDDRLADGAEIAAGTNPLDGDTDDDGGKDGDEVALGSNPLDPMSVIPPVYVDQGNLSGVEDGTSWDRAFTTIGEGIDQAQSGQTVLVRDGTYTGIGNRDLDFRGKPITVRSVNGPEHTVIDCERQEGRAFFFDSGETAEARIQGLTLTGGMENRGGAIYCGSGSPTIADCVFSGNLAVGQGGAIYCGSGSPTIADCVFSGNLASQGGAVYCKVDRYLRLSGCTFSGNTAMEGGAIWMGTGTVARSLFVGNHAGVGGAVLLSKGAASALLVNCGFLGNAATERGGAIGNRVAWEHDPAPADTEFTVLNCTLVGNRAEGQGGAIGLSMVGWAGEEQGYSATVTNSILWGNTVGGVPNQITVARRDPAIDPTLTLGYSLIQGGLAGVQNDGGVTITSGTHNLDSDPLLAFPDDVHLLPGSPCIDAGVLAALGVPPLAADIDGEARIQGAAVDIGADESCGACPGRLAVSPPAITIVAATPGLDPDERLLSIRNTQSGTALDWEVTCPSATGWLTVSPVAGSSAGEVDHVVLQARVAGLSPGDYTCVLRIAGAAGQGNPANAIEVPVTLRITTVRWVDPSYAEGDPNDGHTWGVDAFNTIPDAINATADGDTVILRDGNYTADKPVALVGRSITVRAENGPDYTCVNSPIIVYLTGCGGDALLQGMRFRVAAGATYAVRCQGASPTLLDCVFEDASGTSSDRVGLVTLEGNARPLLERCSFVGRSSGVRHGLYSTDSSPTVRDCTFTALPYGLVIYASTTWCDSEITGCTFSGCGTGATTIHNAPAEIRFANCTFSRNTLRGLAVVAGNGDVSLAVEGSTFYGNTGYALDASDPYAPDGSLVCDITDCLFWGNADPTTKAQVLASACQKLTVSHCGFSQAGTGYHYVCLGTGSYRDSDPTWVITSTSGFRDDAGSDFRLLPGSAFIDRGCDIPGLFSDQRGSLRPVDGDGDGVAEFDLGAFEYAGYWGGGEQDAATNAFKDLRVKGNRILIGYEYRIAWDLRQPLPESDPRIVGPEAYTARLLLDDGRGHQIEILTTKQELDWAELGYTVPFTFGYEHLGTWWLRLELVDDPGQFVLSEEPIVIEYDTPTEYAVGDQILPPDGALASQQPDLDDGGFCFWSETTQKLYAVAPGATTVTWYADAAREIPIPVLVGLDWHDEDESDPLYRPAQGHVAGSPTVALLPAGGPYDSVSLKYSSTNETLADTEFGMPAPPAGSAYHSVLYYHHTRTGAEAIEGVRTVSWQTGVTERPAERDNRDAVIGTAITAPPVHQSACGGGYVINATARLDGSGDERAYDRATRTGPIIPVNEDDPGTDTDDLAVVWYALGISGAAWPFLPMRYAARWPVEAEGLQTLAIETWYVVGATPLDGSGPLDPATYGPASRIRVYHQPDRTALGFNPNEEHALLAASPASPTGVRALYALRHDLNHPNRVDGPYEPGDTSRPYVLLKHQRPTGGGWTFAVFRVVLIPTEPPDSPQYAVLRRPGVSGEALTVPYPIRGLAGGLCSESRQAAGSGPAHQDKNGVWYALQPDANQPVVMNFSYPLQAGMWYDRDGDDLADAATGACIAWHVDLTYDISWPANPPQLQVGATLRTAKPGLPEITGQCDVKLLYGGDVVRLIDPMIARSVPLDALPAGIRVRTRGATQTFVDLPVHLQVRVSWDSTLRRLSFKGYLDDTLAGEPLLLPNIMSGADKTALLALSTADTDKDRDYQAAVSALCPDPPHGQTELSFATAEAKMLSAGAAPGPGYAIVALNDSDACTGPVDLQVIEVTCPLYVGEIKVMEPENVFDERVVLRHTGDCGGESDDRLFQWEWCYDDGGQPDGNWHPWFGSSNQMAGAVEITVEGTGEITIEGTADRTLTDKWFRCCYQHDIPCDTGTVGWSAWTPPQFYQGWIKRVLAAINLFDQRFKDFHESPVSTVADMVRQAGERYEGDVALNYDPDTLNDVGLIEFYTTVLRRGRELMIDAGEPLSTEAIKATNQQLMLIASRLADLYMLLGNEAYADAADPTIGFGTEDGQYGATATSLFCFQNQVPNLLEEELALLRGVAAEGRSPFYNHLVWNFTQTEGEVAYVANYQITDQNRDGAVDEYDARLMVPQGHGDAWGHYLTATTLYYDLLKDSHFDWIPRAEAVLVAGAPVTVDYVDERRFAAAAAAKARTGAEIVDLTYRGRYTEDPEGQWQGYKDTDATRAWGLSEWGQRAGQAALFDWVTGQAVLPVEDTEHTGVRRIDRSTVPELRELAAAYREIQVRLDDADVGLSPLGLAGNAVPFDIDPQQIDAGRTHFEQIHDRAVQALANAVTVFDHANRNTQLLRRQADSTHSFQTTVIEREADFRNRLIEIFGSPYTDDIGPGRTYATGYDGPDLYHYMVVDPSELTGVHEDDAATQAFTVTLREPTVAADGALATSDTPVTYHLSTTGLGIVKPASWTGQRLAPGELQMAHSDLLQSHGRFARALQDYDNLLAGIEDQAGLLQAQYGLNADEIAVLSLDLDTQQSLNSLILKARLLQLTFRRGSALAVILADAAAEFLPTCVGFSTDVAAPARGAIKLGGGIIAQTLEAFAGFAELAELDVLHAKEVAQARTNIALTSARGELAALQQLNQLEQLVRQEASTRYDLYVLQEALQQSQQRYVAALARGQRLLEDRLRFRCQTAASTQEMRYKDMTFRVFRNDALQKYWAQFDLAARYAYLAARAYDYETNLLDGDGRGAGSEFLTQIVRTRSIGLYQDGRPLPAGYQGDPGLADAMARMKLNWDLVLRGQLGFSNPQTETNRFSLRRELYHLSAASQDDTQWRQNLASCISPNLLSEPAFQRYCRAFYPQQSAEPGLIIPFATHVEFGMNFFGLPLWGGDNAYDSTNFATKIRSVGIWFSNYSTLAQNGLSNTPRVYLVPIGDDRLRSPTGYSGETRDWTILDQLIPVPFPISGSDLADRRWIPLFDSLTGDFAGIRRYASFRAYHDSGSFNESEVARDSRLIGRSVWNTHWLLIIPAGTLHSDRTEALRRFIYGRPLASGPVLDDAGQRRDGNGVSDIRLFFQTYAYSGAKK
jgi:predicted outer membrane repeat protein